MSIADIRRSYDKSELREDTLASTPMAQLAIWLSEAIDSDLVDATAMTLATADASGQPSARIVLLKDHNERGLVFFTNYESRKGQDLAGNPRASLLFYWATLERQVRIEGHVAKLSSAESDAYYQSRPLESRVGAWASPQSQVITRPELEARVARYTRSLGDNPSRPEFWGGYRLTPDYAEFWQGRPSRLNDRIVYHPQSNGGWSRSRLAP